MNFVKRARNLYPIEKRNKLLSFIIGLFALSLDNFNVSGGLTSTTSVQTHFNCSSTDATWVISGYALTLGAFILIFGKLADILGPHNVFIAGTLSTMVFALICAVIENSIIALIIFRALQGIAAAALIPSGIALTACYFGNDKKAMGYATKFLIVSINGAFGFGTVIGGAFALTNVGYKAFFYFVFGVAFVSGWLLFFFMAPVEQTEEQKSLKLKDLNYVGVVLIIVGLLLVILGLTEGGNNWKSAKSYVPLPIGFFLITGVVLFDTVYIRSYRAKHANKIPVQEEESDQPQPQQRQQLVNQIGKTGIVTRGEEQQQIDWRLTVDYLFPPECLKIPNFLVFLFIMIFNFIAFTVLLTGYFQYHNFIDEDSTLIAALKILPASIGIIFGAMTYREEYVKKLGTKWFMISSTTFALGASIWFSRVDFTVKYYYFKYEMISFFLYGWAINYFFSVFLNSIMQNTPLHLQGSVSGIYWTVGQVGVAIGDAVFVSVAGELFPVKSHEEKVRLHENIVKGIYVELAATSASFIVSLFTVDTDGDSRKSVNNDDDLERNVDMQ